MTSLLSSLPTCPVRISRCSVVLCSLHQRSFYKGPRDTVQTHPHPDEHSFERLGLQARVLAGLRLAFPSVKHPTHIQHRFVEELLKGKDVLLKDSTGSGKSFALALALLSQQRSPPSRDPDTHAHIGSITSLLLVPHRDLAYQYLHWIQRIHHHMPPRPPALPHLAQVLVRDASVPLHEHLAPLQRAPPHILISTPQAVLDAVRADARALPLERLSTVVVDEADYLIESVPLFKDKYKMKKIERQIARHPGATRQLLDHIYGVREGRREGAQQREDGKLNRGAREERQGRSPMAAGPQLVMMSATLRNHLRRFLLRESGWFNKGPGTLVKITGNPSAYHPKTPQDANVKADAEDQAAAVVGGKNIKHHVLVVGPDGEVQNDEDAVDDLDDEMPHGEASQPGASATSPATPEGHMSLSPSVEAEESLGFDTGETEEAEEDPSSVNPNLLDAVAATLALDCPSIALLVLPSDAPVQKVVRDLRRLSVDAKALDVVKDEQGKAHLMRRDLDSTAENPTLLVSTLASTRGLDLPELSHVFVLGVLDQGAVDSYLHVAGRVGRFGRSGKVISVVGKAHTVEEGGKPKVVDEPRWMRLLLKKIGVQATKLSVWEH